MTRRTFCLIIIAICFLVPIGASARIVNQIAAVVDDEVITVLDVNHQATPIVQAFTNSPEGKKLDPAELMAQIGEIKKQILKDMIEQKLLEAEIKRLGIPVSDRDIDEYVDRIKAANRMTDEQLVTALVADGTSLGEFREKIKLQILREQYVTFRLKNKIEVTEEEAKAFFKQNPEQFVAERIVSLSEIRIPIAPESSETQIDAARAKAASLYTELLAGGDFATIAKKNSAGPTATSGGKLGSWKLDSELSSGYRKAAGDLLPGQIAPPYLDDKGYVILRCDAWEKSGYLAYDEVSGKIKAELRKKAAEQEMKKLAKELYKKSFVDIKVEDF